MSDYQIEQLKNLLERLVNCKFIVKNQDNTTQTIQMQNYTEIYIKTTKIVKIYDKNDIVIEDLTILEINTYYSLLFFDFLFKDDMVISISKDSIPELTIFSYYNDEIFVTSDLDIISCHDCIQCDKIIKIIIDPIMPERYIELYCRSESRYRVYNFLDKFFSVPVGKMIFKD